MKEESEDPAQVLTIRSRDPIHPTSHNNKLTSRLAKVKMILEKNNSSSSYKSLPRAVDDTPKYAEYNKRHLQRNFK